MEKNELKSIALFSGLSDEEISVVLPILEEQKYHSGRTVYAAGEISEKLFIISKGSVIITHELDNDIITIANIQQGQFFGEAGILKESKKHQSEARAQADDTIILKLSRDNFLKLKKENPEIIASILEKISNGLSERLTHDTTRIAIISAISDLVNNPDNLNNINTLAQKILSIIIHAIPSHQAFLGIYKKYEKNQIDIIASIGLSPKHMPKSLPIDSDPYLHKLYAKDGEMRVSSGEYESQEKVFYAKKNLLARAIKIEGENIGVLLLSDKEQGEFSSQNSLMLSIAAGQISFAVEEAHLRKEKTAQEELKREYVGI
ncbi:cyclic nucleotide-binding domain-containing protein [Patescibacteria group bacterium]|nr:cyclic nucleotide-binding domain-containing protein [Patescibacteria group bacterium]